MRPLLLVAVIAGIAAACAAPAKPRPAAHAAEIPAPIRAPGNGELLEALGPTGADWEEVLARVPPDRARAVAVTFLRQGGFACRAIVAEEIGCGDAIEAFAPVAPGATLADPCLRRLVAGWALARLEATEAGAVADALAAIVALPHPEQALIEAAVALVPPRDDRLRLRLIEAALGGGREDAADLLLPGLSPGAAAHALVELGREGALAHLGDVTPAGALAAALERGLSQQAALDALDRLETKHLADARVLAAVIGQAASTDCAVAARAALLLDAAGDAQHLPSRAALTDAAAATRALCVSTHISDDESRAVLRALVSADGFDLVDVDHTYMLEPELPDPDLDGDHDPYTRATRRHVGPQALDDEVLASLPTACVDGHCYGPTGTVTLSFGDGAGRALALDEVRIERAENGCGC